MSNIIAIPLNKLTRSARNVRKSVGDSIDDLATSILVHGLIHNLTVVEQQADNGKNSGKYEVVAGGRRFAALQRFDQIHRSRVGHPRHSRKRGCSGGDRNRYARPSFP
jgi:ParB family transcriptional regulator, chromosome partitioning protein